MQERTMFLGEWRRV